jgi:hypothetical protein
LNFVIPSVARNLLRPELSHWDAANCPTPNGTTSEALLPSSPAKNSRDNTLELSHSHVRQIPLQLLHSFHLNRAHA